MKDVLFLRGKVVRADVTGLRPRLLVAKYLERQTREIGAVRSTELTNPPNCNEFSAFSQQLNKQFVLQCLIERADHLKKFQQNVSTISYVCWKNQAIYSSVFDIMIAHIVFLLFSNLLIICTSHLSNLRVSYW